MAKKIEDSMKESKMMKAVLIFGKGSPCEVVGECPNRKIVSSNIVVAYETGRKKFRYTTYGKLAKYGETHEGH